MNAFQALAGRFRPRTMRSGTIFTLFPEALSKTFDCWAVAHCYSLSKHGCVRSEAHGKDVRFAKVDIDAQGSIAESSGISVVPTFHFFESGKVWSRMCV